MPRNESGVSNTVGEEVNIQPAELAKEGDEGTRFTVGGVEYICPPGTVPATCSDGTAGCAQ
jgi:hypothetical protein